MREDVCAKFHTILRSLYILVSGVLPGHSSVIYDGVMAFQRYHCYVTESEAVKSKGHLNNYGSRRPCF